MNEYLVVYLEPTDYYIKVIKYGWNGEEEDVIKHSEIKNTIIKANNKKEIYEKIDYEIINIIELN